LFENCQYAQATGLFPPYVDDLTCLVKKSLAAEYITNFQTAPKH